MQFNKKQFHLILLDVMMPGIDGFEVLKRIRETSDIPVIMVTAKEDEIDRINGFVEGVDDYVVKPFSPRELKLYTNSMKLYKGESNIDITTTEYELLHTFIKNKNQILTREQLIRQSFGQLYDGFDRNIDSYIKRIRQKIEDEPKNPRYLKTKYGKGYVFGGEDI